MTNSNAKTGWPYSKKPLSGQLGKSLPRVEAFHWLDLLVRSSPFPRHAHRHPAPARELTQPRPETVCSQKITNAEILLAGATEFTECKALHSLLVGKEATPGPLWGENHTYDRKESGQAWDVRSHTHDWHTDGVYPAGCR